MKVGIVISPDSNDKFPLQKTKFILHAKQHLPGFDKLAAANLSNDMALAAMLFFIKPHWSVEIMTYTDLLKKQCTAHLDMIVPYYDISTVFMDHGGMRAVKRFEKLLRCNSLSISPPLSFQHFIVNKYKYYKLLQSAGIPVATTKAIAVKDIKDMESAKKWIARLHSDGFMRIIVKPAYGGYSNGIRIFPPVANMTPRAVLDYFNKLRTLGQGTQFATYQEFVPSFGKNFEVRTYWAGEKYAYSVATKTKKVTGISGRNSGLSVDMFGNFASEGGRMSDELLKKLKRLGSQVIAVLPSIGVPYPFLRIDFGCCLKRQCTEYFVNEIEFAPNMLLDHASHPQSQIKKIAQAFADYAESRKEIKPMTDTVIPQKPKIAPVCKFKS